MYPSLHMDINLFQLLTMSQNVACPLRLYNPWRIFISSPLESIGLVSINYSIFIGKHKILLKVFSLSLWNTYQVPGCLILEPDGKVSDDSASAASLFQHPVGNPYPYLHSHTCLGTSSQELTDTLYPGNSDSTYFITVNKWSCHGNAENRFWVSHRT